MGFSVKDSGQIFYDSLNDVILCTFLSVSSTVAKLSLEMESTNINLQMEKDS